MELEETMKAQSKSFKIKRKTNVAEDRNISK
jgi:hypothetical protein